MYNVFSIVYITESSFLGLYLVEEAKLIMKGGEHHGQINSTAIYVGNSLTMHDPLFPASQIVPEKNKATFLLNNKTKMLGKLLRMLENESTDLLRSFSLCRSMASSSPLKLTTNATFVIQTSFSSWTFSPTKRISFMCSNVPKILRTCLTSWTSMTE